MERPAELNTYAGWIRLGRAVRKGEKSAGRVRHRGGNLAVFHVDSTEPFHDVDWDLVDEVQGPANADLEPKTPAPGPGARGRNNSAKYKVIPAAGGGATIRVWAGSSRELAQLLRRSDFRFDIRAQRWLAWRENPAQTLEGLRAFATDHNLILKEDNR